jgi:hypothetical protein
LDFSWARGFICGNIDKKRRQAQHLLIGVSPIGVKSGASVRQNVQGLKIDGCLFCNQNLCIVFDAIYPYPQLVSMKLNAYPFFSST